MMLGSMHPMETFGNVCTWLCDSHAFQVSPFAILPPFVIQTLDPDLYRSDLDATVTTPGSIDPIGMY